jgi:hypothetical protein
MPRTPKETLLEQERFELKAKSGGELLSYEVWGYLDKGKTVVTHYNIAFFNHEMYAVKTGAYWDTTMPMTTTTATTWAKWKPWNSPATTTSSSASRTNGRKS